LTSILCITLGELCFNRFLKPSRRIGKDFEICFVYRFGKCLEKHQKVENCFGTPRGSPKGVASRDVVCPRGRFFIFKSLYKSFSWKENETLALLFLEKEFPFPTKSTSLSKLEGLICFNEKILLKILWGDLGLGLLNMFSLFVLFFSFFILLQIIMV